MAAGELQVKIALATATTRPSFERDEYRIAKVRREEEKGGNLWPLAIILSLSIRL